MGVQPTINGKVVERSYEDYHNDVYLVNRRYQRKLVWSVEEKRAFIDSLINGYPVPLFLFSASEYQGVNRNEIIDGMQRLNAIFSFIENEYDLRRDEDKRYYGYFDLSSTALTKELLDKGLLYQKQPVMDRSICVRIVSYELPYSIYDVSDPNIIDEVFRRINSNGQHLSRQEIRQAGATSTFAELVRRLSTQIRGDVSHGDLLLLSQMKGISIQQTPSEQGIEADSVFWVRQNIINKEGLRKSIDEELVADLLASLILPQIPPSNVQVLNEYYGFKAKESDARAQRVQEALQAADIERVSTEFLYVIDEIKKLFADRPHTIIDHMLGPQYYRGPRYFQVLYLSLYNLLVKKGMKIADYDKLYDALYNIGVKLPLSSGGGKWGSGEKIEAVDVLTALILRCFAERNGGDPMYNSYTTELETLLRQSQTENNQYDFKQGLHNLATGARNDPLLTKVFKTLTAMANAGKNAVGYVILGVADREEDAEKIQQVYGVEPVRVGNFYVTGVDGEVQRYYGGDYQAYLAMLHSALDRMPISAHYRRQIGAKLKSGSYKGRTFYILKIVNDNGAAIFGEHYYTRSCAANEPEPVRPEEMPAFFKMFY